jgi:hypothetical protein
LHSKVRAEAVSRLRFAPVPLPLSTIFGPFDPFNQ